MLPSKLCLSYPFLAGVHQGYLPDSTQAALQSDIEGFQILRAWVYEDHSDAQLKAVAEELNRLTRRE